MVFFSQQMLRIAVELAIHDPHYEEFVAKFFPHMWIEVAMAICGGDYLECCGCIVNGFAEAMPCAAADGNANQTNVVNFNPITKSSKS